METAPLSTETRSSLGTGSVWESPEPVLLNAWKHHAGFLRLKLNETIAAGSAALPGLANALVVVGTELMDLYHGGFTPAEIATKVVDALRVEGRLDLATYRGWIAEAGGYRALDFAEDASRWVLRLGDEAGRYVHVHPARWAPETVRVRANVLKTAVMALAFAGLHLEETVHVGLVNHVRREYLGLAPVGRDLSGDAGIGAVIKLLKS